MSGVGIAQLQAMLETLQVSPMQLEAVAQAMKMNSGEVITVEGFYDRALEAAPARSVDAYRTYWKRFIAEHGTKPINQVIAKDIEQFASQCVKNAAVRRNSRGGSGTGRTAIAALRCFFQIAFTDGLIPSNPGVMVKQIRRPKSPSRRALTVKELKELDEVTRSGGDDPMLDALLVRFHLETAARRGGGLALRVCDLDDNGQSVLLREKGGTETWQPISRSLLLALRIHATERGAESPLCGVFRTRAGDPIGRYRYDTLTNRWQRELPWAAKYGVTPHWLRHTAGTIIERLSNRAVASAFLRHVPGGDGVTGHYTKASQAEVAAAVAQMTGESHPLAGGWDY
jgi:integrase/recombinase XerC